ncbi:putative fatty acyl-CoA reductase CG5065 [Daphnia carinata]|uniref:putative fatty acyl-CoA reductase CG5065 n=1 Tax=Daphnia carinata TaxID=120202 RepID=UPI00257AB254|nr:putative fatty acyl-CoA reductase CG5065 [Daphnia carinata]
MSENTNMEQLSIPEFYKGRSVFITGATGFMGKVLVEKLLRSCPGIERIYLLMRPSKGQSVECRLQDLINNQIFDTVRKQQLNVMSKLTATAGDVTLPGLGLSVSDMHLLIENVSIVFNSAATIKFNEELKDAIEMNVKGPMQLLNICRQMKRLEAFVHVSTAFNNLDREEMKEQVYRSQVDPVKLIQLLDCLDDNVVKKIAPELIGNCPNTYTYTKALAEQLLEEQCGNVPLAIVRPSIVTGALKEPIPGWVDNYNGATGTIAAVGKGFFRIMKINSELVSDIIPVDYPINLMIAVAWHLAIRRPNEVPVYSCTTGHRNPLTWGGLRRFALDSWLKYPTKDMMWYPSASYTINDIWFKANQALFHTIPAHLFDMFYTLTGKRTRWVRMYAKAALAFSSLEFFTTHQWRFLSNNPIRLLEELSNQDKKTFYFDVREIDWKSYFETYVLGTRRFVLKDDPSTLPLAKRNLNRLYTIRMVLRLLFFFSVFTVLLRTFKPFLLPAICLQTAIFLLAEFLSV